MVALDDDTKRSLKKIFDSKFKGNNIDSSDIKEIPNSNLLGEEVISRIRKTPINDIEFGRVVRELNSYIEQIFESTGKNLIPCPLNLYLTKSELNDLDSIDSILKIASHKEDKVLKELILKIELLSSEISQNAIVLSSQLSELKEIIDSQQTSDDTNHKLRMNLLRQIYTFNTVRIEGIKNLQEVGNTALTNAHNYLQYTKPNIDFNLAAKVQVVDLEKCMNSLNTSIINKIIRFNRLSMTLFITSKIAFYSAILFTLENALLKFLFYIDFYEIFKVVVCLSFIYMIISFICLLGGKVGEFDADSSKLEEDYFKYIKEKGSFYFNFFVPIFAILPFIVNEVEGYKLYSISTTLLLLVLSFSIFKLFKFYVIKANIPLVVLSHKLKQVFLSYLDSKK